MIQARLFDGTQPAGEGLSDEQQAAVAARTGSIALAANAGSGKTRVLVERFVRAVIEDGIAPGRILAITFTERAAGELRTRVRGALIAAGARGAAHETAAAPISTFHAFAMRLLRAHPLLAALPPDFVVLDEAQAADLRDQAFRSALARWQEQEEALELAAAFGVEGLRVALLDVYDERRSHGEEEPRLPRPEPVADISKLTTALRTACAQLARTLGEAEPIPTVSAALERLERCGELLAAEPQPGAIAELALPRGAKALDCAQADAYEHARDTLWRALAAQRAAAAMPLLDELLHAFSADFAALKQARGGADFDDLELAAARLLSEHAEVARAWRERFDLLMVDELQDTNPRQMRILAELDRDNLFTVGDAFQSIYSFRHASVEIFRDRFARLRESGRALVLSANYRSRASILDSANAVFTPHFGTDFVTLRAGREDAAGGPPVELIVADTDGWQEHAEQLGAQRTQAGLWRTAEARLLAARIDELIASGNSRAGEIVVLLRAASEIAIYETEIAALGHATLTPAGAGFYARPEIVDLSCYIRALANPFDDLALYGVLASPLCGADADDALVALAIAAREGAGSVWAALDAEPQLRDFAARFEAARAAAPEQALGELVACALSDHGYERYLCQLPAAQRRVANVRKLIRLAREFEYRQGRDLRRFADALAAGRLGSLRESEAPPPLGDAIRLMTVHAAKGLEFPVVCLADLGHGPNNTPPALLTDGRRIGIRLPSIGHKAIPALDYEELAAQRSAREAAEERRVYYVAMTRAREHLILSGAARLSRWPGADACALAWLGPALIPDLAERALRGAAGPEIVAGADGVPVRLTIAAAGALGAPTAPAAEPAVPVPTPPAPRVAAASGEAAHLSYTALAAYERCGYRYHLQRILGMPDAVPPPGVEPGTGAAERGTLVHALLEQLDFANPRAPDAATVAATAARLGVAGAQGTAAQLVAAFARSPLCARLAAVGEVAREEQFGFVHEATGELVRGVFDAVGTERDGTLLIVDYKTDALAPGEDLAAHVERDYSLQRLLYALAALSAGATEVEVAHCFLNAPEVGVSARYSATQRPRLERELTERLAPLRGGSFAVTAYPGLELCATCPGRARLCSYSEAVTLAPGGR